MTRLTPDEMFAAGYGGNYMLDPKTGKRSLIEETKPTTAAHNDGPVRRKQPDPDQAGGDIRG